ncbi:MAG: hypothetical protein HFI57_08830 [Lachnospiraceae bacterium]|nr:hypothetical protein [Lachnospiraceae bacterium]
MKRRMLTAVLIVVVLAALVFAGWYVMFMYFGIGPAFPFIKAQKLDLESMDQATIADNSLMAAAETEEEAKEIAEQYGIEFVSFENGIALFYTEESPFEVIARGQENGYAQLSINFVRVGYDTDEVQ